ncbi:hypothetical protein [Amycolatopsis anabasis]|uniref:hypothetical protein n=1 Tax=Amycolatopsis anabasis TaxID=1840409 RepID=UPI00131CD55F|nr:hypothetical protein [Amycolatopsis anabasis]
MRRALPPHVCGEQVRVALLEARPATLSTKHLVAATNNLSVYQVKRGLIYVREHLAAQYGTPLIYVPGQGFLITEDPADVVPFAQRQFKTEYTRFKRLLTGTIDPFFACHPTDDWGRRVRDMLAGSKTTMENLSDLEP